MLTLSHKKLDAWKYSMEVVKLIYQITARFPKEEQFILVQQLRRAAVSVCSNLAEGSARTTPADKRRFYEISRSSLVEIDTQIEIAISLGYLKKENLVNLEHPFISLFKTITGLIEKYTESKSNSQLTTSN